MMTATWFVAGAVAGGATLGAVMRALALAVEALGIGVAAAAGATAVIALVGAASDVHVLPWSPPFNRRQVNEDWLPRYRGGSTASASAGRSAPESPRTS